MKTKMTVKYHSLKISLLMSGVMLALRLASAQCDPPPSGLVAWWPGEGDANDIVGTNNGTLLNGAFTAASCAVGQAFRFNTTDAGVFIPESPSLDVGQQPGFTIETWVCPADVSHQLPIVEWNGGFGAQFWISVPGPYGSGPGSLSANIVDIGVVNHVVISPPGIVQANQPQHVALTFNKFIGKALLFLNGQIVAQQSFGNIVPRTSSFLYIGHRPPPASGVGSFNGSIDELSIYNRDLSTNEIAKIYAAGSAGKCRSPFITSQPQSQIGYWGQSAVFSVAALPNSPPLSYQWQSNGAAISGMTNQTLTLINLQNSFAAGYTVVVSNSFGSVTSAPPANLTINPAGVAIALYPGVKIDGVVGLTYGIQSSTNLANTNS